MPHKRNPVASVLIRAGRACAPRAGRHAASPRCAQEHERAAGAWHAEWAPLRELLHLAGGRGRRLTPTARAGWRCAERSDGRPVAGAGSVMFAEAVVARAERPALGREPAHRTSSRAAAARRGADRHAVPGGPPGRRPS